MPSLVTPSELRERERERESLEGKGSKDWNTVLCVTALANSKRLRSHSYSDKESVKHNVKLQANLL